MLHRAPIVFSLCLFMLPLSLVVVVYWLFFLKYHKTPAEEDSRTHVTNIQQHATAEFSITRQALGYVIGKEGSSVRQVEETTSTCIRFKENTLDANEKMVVITGRPEAVTRAQSAINEMMESWSKRKNLSVVSLNIPKHAVGRIIGKQGANIQSLQRETGAQISVKKIGSGDERECIIRGSDSEVQMAQQLLKETIAQISSVGGSSEVVAVPLKAVGKIIGRQGSNVQRIQQDSGALVTLEQNDVGEEVGKFLVKGTEHQIEKAKAMLLGYTTGSQLSHMATRDLDQTDVNLLISSELPKTLEYFAVFVSAVEADGHVWLQEVGQNCSKLDALIDTMTSTYDQIGSTQDRLADITIGTVCAATFCFDGSWYRAVVEDVDTINGTATVRYADFGDTDKVELAMLKTLRPEYFVLPIQAIRCSLANVKCRKNWSVRSEQDLRSLTLCSTWKPLMARARVIHLASTPCVELIDTTTEKDINIASEMVALGHMEWNRDTAMVLKADF